MGRNKDKKFEAMRTGGKKEGKKGEETTNTETPKIKGCHVSIDVTGGCKLSDPVPDVNSIAGVKLACSNHNCPFANSRSVHKECFNRLTDKIVGMLTRTGSSSWTDEQRRENVWRKKGLTFVGKYITCPCGHGTQTLEDSENRWSRMGEVVLDANEFEKQREVKIKKALHKQEKPIHHTMGKNLNCTFGGKDQVQLEKKLCKLEWEKEERITRVHSGTATSTPSPKQRPPIPTFPSPSLDDDGFTTIGKDGRARDQLAGGDSVRMKKVKASPTPLQSIVVPNYPNPFSTSMSSKRAVRDRTVSTSSNTSYGVVTKKKEKREGRNKENQHGGSTRSGRGWSVLQTGSDDEEEEWREEEPVIKCTQQSMREFVDKHINNYGIGSWSPSQVIELNQHLCFLHGSATFRCRVTGRVLEEPLIMPELTPKDAWMMATLAMHLKKDDIPVDTQLFLREYYAIFYDYEVKYAEDPIVWCKNGTQAALECVDMICGDLVK